MKKKPKKHVLPIIIVLLILVIGSIITIKNFIDSTSIKEVKVITTIEKYNYTLDENETDIYKKYFKELESCLNQENIDEEEYAKLISKLFVIDFYTLNNKITNKDIGGIQFLKEDIKENFSLKASNTIYKYVKSNIYGKRKQDLPEVMEVDVKKIEDTKSEKKETPTYNVELSIKYVKNMGYTESVLLTLVKENDKIYIVAIKEVV